MNDPAPQPNARPAETGPVSQPPAQEGEQGPWTETVRTPDALATVTLTHAPLSASAVLDAVRSPAAGALVLFAGTTRDTFDSKPVKQLQYTAYVPLALRTMLSVAEQVRDAHGLKGVAMAHRLGVVPVGEESVLIAVAAPHREAAWRAGEQALEEVKEKVEVWKLEEFWGGEGVWRANRDGKKGVKVGDGADVEISEGKSS